MGYTRAIILGNGESRRGIDIPDDCDVWATNLAFRETMGIDYLVSTDVGCQHEIYRAGWVKNNPCYFLDWDPMGSDEIDPGIFASTGARVDCNQYTKHGVVVSGTQDIMYFTYLNEQDNVTNIRLIDLPMELASGQLAMYLAAKSGLYNEIKLAGFGDEVHLYNDNVPNLEVWEKEREYVINRFDNIKWRYIQ